MILSSSNDQKFMRGRRTARLDFREDCSHTLKNSENAHTRATLMAADEPSPAPAGNSEAMLIWIRKAESIWLELWEDWMVGTTSSCRKAKKMATAPWSTVEYSELFSERNEWIFLWSSTEAEKGLLLRPSSQGDDFSLSNRESKKVWIAEIFHSRKALLSRFGRESLKPIPSGRSPNLGRSWSSNFTQTKVRRSIAVAMALF